MATKTLASQSLMGRLLNLWKTSSDEIPDLYPYKLRDPLLPSSETRFYQILLAIIGKRVVICPKMRLADLFRVQASDQHHKAFYNRLANRSVDFLLCERYTLKPLLAIELYDHNQPRVLRKQRDTFVDKVFKAAKLPILHLVVQKEYNLKALALRIAPFLTTVAYARGAEPMMLDIPPRCPCCGVPMVKRTVISGSYKGHTYFSCRNFPECCERLPLSKSLAYVN
jgi:hypothetical protein